MNNTMFVFELGPFLRGRHATLQRPGEHVTILAARRPTETFLQARGLPVAVTHHTWDDLRLSNGEVYAWDVSIQHVWIAPMGILLRLWQTIGGTPTVKTPGGVWLNAPLFPSGVCDTVAHRVVALPWDTPAGLIGTPMPDRTPTPEATPTSDAVPPGNPAVVASVSQPDESGHPVWDAQCQTYHHTTTRAAVAWVAFPARVAAPVPCCADCVEYAVRRQSAIVVAWGRR